MESIASSVANQIAAFEIVYDQVFTKEYQFFHSSATSVVREAMHEIMRAFPGNKTFYSSSIFFAGANANKQDQFGRSPVHVAAAVDYAEMVDFLLQNGAEIAMTTYGEGQTPLHYAAKNDAVNSLQTLLGYGADIDARDSKNRTPLQVNY